MYEKYKHKGVRNIEKILPPKTVKGLHEKMWNKTAIIQEIVMVLTHENIGQGRDPLLGSEYEVIVPVIREKRCECHQRIKSQAKTTDAKDIYKAIR